jgi:hypothetical protein
MIALGDLVYSDAALGPVIGSGCRREAGALLGRTGQGMRGRGPIGGADEFVREVDEAVRQDRWMKLWKEYGAYIVGAALAIVLGSAAGVLWRNWQESERLAEAARFAEAQQLLHQDEPAQAAEAFAALAEDADGGYAVLAKLRAAEAQAGAGDAAAKAATLERLADDPSATPLYRQLAELLALQHDFANLDSNSARSRAEPLAEEAAPWRYSALELRALAEIEAGDLDAARATLQSVLSDPQTPPNLSRRAAELMASIGGPAGADAAAGVVGQDQTAVQDADPNGAEGAAQ